MNSENAVAKIQLKLLNERAFSSGESCTCEYVTLLQSFRRGTLSIHWHIAQNLWPTFSMSVLYMIYKYILYIYICIYIILYIYIYIWYIFCPRCREEDESHTHFIFYCKLSKVTLAYTSELINLNYYFNIPFKFSLKTIMMGFFSIL